LKTKHEKTRASTINRAIFLTETNTDIHIDIDIIVSTKETSTPPDNQPKTSQQAEPTRQKQTN